MTAPAFEVPTYKYVTVTVSENCSPVTENPGVIAAADPVKTLPLFAAVTVMASACAGVIATNAELVSW